MKTKKFKCKLTKDGKPICNILDEIEEIIDEMLKFRGRYIEVDEIEEIIDEMLKFRGRYIEVDEFKQKLKEMEK